MTKSNTDGQELDFSEAAARKAAFAETIQHPLTLMPVAIGAVGAIGGAVLTSLTMPAAIGIAAVGFIVGGANWAYRFFGRGNTYMQKHYEEVHQEFEKLKERKLENIGGELKELSCTQGSDQVEQFEEKFRNLTQVLQRILSEGELTYSRFLGAAELVYKSGIENLDRIVTIMTNIHDIDRGSLGRRIEKLKARDPRTEAENKTLTTFQERAQLYDDGQKEIADLLARNEEALTAMDKAGVSVGRFKASAVTSDNLELAMGDLVGLITRINSRANSKPLDATEEPQTK